MDADAGQSNPNENEEDEAITNLEQMLDRLEEGTQDEDNVSIGKMMDIVGSRSFGPVLLLVGLIALSPLSGIPGMPTLVAVTVILIAVQMVLHRKHFWLPQWLLKRAANRHKFTKAIHTIRPVARFIDRFLRPRLCWLTGRAGKYVIAAFCVVIALSMPPLEPLPFLATTAGAALTAFALALVAHDGVLALLAFGFTGGVLYLVMQRVFF